MTPRRAYWFWLAAISLSFQGGMMAAVGTGQSYYGFSTGVSLFALSTMWFTTRAH